MYNSLFSSYVYQSRRERIPELNGMINDFFLFLNLKYHLGFIAILNGGYLIISLGLYYNLFISKGS